MRWGDVRRIRMDVYMRVNELCVDVKQNPQDLVIVESLPPDSKGGKSWPNLMPISEIST
jgi:hypothetical protein